MPKGRGFLLTQATLARVTGSTPSNPLKRAESRRYFLTQSSCGLTPNVFYVAQVITLQRVFGATTSNTIYVKVHRCRPKAHRRTSVPQIDRRWFHRHDLWHNTREVVALYTTSPYIPMTKARGFKARFGKVLSHFTPSGTSLRADYVTAWSARCV